MSQSITEMEYFYDVDPGFGNATAIAPNANSGILTQQINIPTPLNETGFTTLYLRVKDNNNVWSLYNAITFYITDIQTGGATSITGLEYFIDNDPGMGNATALSVNTNSGSLTQTYSISMGTLTEGFHKLYIRTQDDLGTWSLYDKRTFFVTPEPNNTTIVSAEYFYDTDPGLGNGTSTTLAPTGNPNEFTIDLSTVDVSCGLHDFYIRLVNDDGTWSLYDYGLDVDVYDNANPTIVLFPDITVELNESGQGSLTLDDVNNGTYDDCQLVSVTLNQAQFDYTCANLGINTVTITAIDAEDKVSTQEVTITVVDNINPVAISQNITVQLDASGQASITPSQIENGSTDNCGIASRSLDVTNFTCANLGNNTVIFSVEDASGNSNSTSAVVTVVDNINPVAISQDITVQLDASGEANITANDIDNGSTDNCSILNKSLDTLTFTCDDLGDNTVTLTITDSSNNSSSSLATVTVVDDIAPVTLTQDITIQLNANGEASIIAEDLDNGSYDNCSVLDFYTDVTFFTCDDLGANNVELIVSDLSGNSSSSQAVITIVDNAFPSIIVQDITVQLDTNGQANITVDDIDNGSTDNCSIASRSLDISSFNCDDLGMNTVELAITDTGGNVNSGFATVTIVDNLNPQVIGQDITRDLTGASSITILAIDVDNGSTDNCDFSLSLDQDTFTTPGTYPVILTATDNSGNANTTTVTVTIIDSTLSTNDVTKLDHQVKLYPNPTKSILSVRTDLVIEHFEIYDVSGRKIKSIKNQNNSVNTSDLSEGTYFIKLYLENTYIIKRFIKKN